jgi:hypothetical protein
MARGDRGALVNSTVRIGCDGRHLAAAYLPARAAAAVDPFTVLRRE